MEYKVIYSDRKTISITVKDEKVIVKSPFGATKSQIDDIVTSHIRWIEKHIKIQSERKNQQGELTEEKIKILRKRAKEILPIKTEHFANIMGLKYGRITITSATTRFGSCSSKGNICFSYRLMLYPIPAREYVIVHELCHLVYMNHSRNFYSLLESFLPDYKERRRMLK